jgi:hypothetical protein
VIGNQIEIGVRTHNQVNETKDENLNRLLSHYVGKNVLTLVQVQRVLNKG